MAPDAPWPRCDTIGAMCRLPRDSRRSSSCASAPAWSALGARLRAEAPRATPLRRRGRRPARRRSTGRAVPADRAGGASKPARRGGAARWPRACRARCGRCINATGVIIHTNLGRAPLPRRRADRASPPSRGGYSNLDTTSTAGARGSRTVHAEALLTALTGAEAAVVVNNNAAATLLILAALARGREVLISRGELVEIGGGFRVPDVMAQSGRDPARSRHDQPHARSGLPRGDRPADGADPARAPVELPHRGLHRAPVARRARRGRHATRVSRSSRTSAAAACIDDVAGRAVGAGVDRRRRRPGVLQRRQAARRTAGRHHRRARSSRGAAAARIR